MYVFRSYDICIGLDLSDILSSEFRVILFPFFTEGGEDGVR